MVSRNMENKHTIYFNMCHHYRKILNAKPCVDTSPPKVLQTQTKTATHWRYSCGTSPLSQKMISQEVKNFPTHNSIVRQSKEPVICQYYYQHHKKELETNDVNKSFLSKKSSNSVAPNKDRQPALRNLRIYHPPRRKPKVTLNVTNSSKSPSVKKEDRNEEKLRNRVSDPVHQDNQKLPFSAADHSYSEESSEDSAYNEGECVMSSDSRGSTPENSTVKCQLADTSPATEQRNQNQSTRPVSSSARSEDEIQYLRFLKEITNDILKKNIFTNKALRSVFQHHIEINKYNLDEDKMVNEVAKLQERLGVPKDNKLDDEDYGLGKDISDEEAENTTMKTGSDTIPAVPSATDTLPESKSENQNEDSDGGADDYSDSFSDVSQSEQGESEDDEDEAGSDAAPSSSHDEAHEDEESLEESLAVEKNYANTATNSDVNSDSEISEIC